MLLLIYSVLGIVALPFSVVMVVMMPLVIGGENNPNHPAVAPFTLLFLGVPILILTGVVGGWVSWFKRRGRAALIYALLPVVYGGLAIAVLTMYTG